jgi:hypothetical protein
MHNGKWAAVAIFSEPVSSQRHDSKDGGDLEPTFYQGPFPSHLLPLSFCYTFILTHLVFVFSSTSRPRLSSTFFKQTVFASSHFGYKLFYTHYHTIHWSVCLIIPISLSLSLSQNRYACIIYYYQHCGCSSCFLNPGICTDRQCKEQRRHILGPRSYPRKSSGRLQEP